jgi:basic membrane lipoprotein Med (substrate-binding protein (PBP1-ABC) superfamily)
MGADAIMAVAGPQTIDTVQEIKSQHSKTIVIGVDTAQENSDVNATSVFIDRTGNNKIIKFSAVKNISYMVSAIS